MPPRWPYSEEGGGGWGVAISYFISFLPWKFNWFVAVPCNCLLQTAYTCQLHRTQAYNLICVFGFNQCILHLSTCCLYVEGLTRLVCVLLEWSAVSPKRRRIWMNTSPFIRKHTTVSSICYLCRQKSHGLQKMLLFPNQCSTPTRFHLKIYG